MLLLFVMQLGLCTFGMHCIESHYLPRSLVSLLTPSESLGTGQADLVMEVCHTRDQ